MAATTPSPHSPCAPRFSGDGDHSPQFRRSNLQSPWAQVVRGDLDSIPPVTHSPSSSSPPSSSPPGQKTHFVHCSTSKASSEPPTTVDDSEAEALPDSDSSYSNAAGPKKPAWKKPSNGVVDVDRVMDAVSWPALSELARVSPKLPSDSSKCIPDASVSVSQVPVTPLSPGKQGTNSANSSSTPNHAMPVRQRSMKRGGGSSGGRPSRSSFAQPSLPPPPPPPPPFPVFTMSPSNYGNLVPVLPNLSTRGELPYRGNNWENRMNGGHGSQSHVANSHLVQRNASRRGNFRSRHHMDSSRRTNYGSRGDQDHGNHDLNSPHVSTGRDVHIQPQRAPPRGFMSPPPSTAAFVTTHPQPVRRPFGSPMGFTDMTSQVYMVPALPPESFRGFPFVAHAPPPPTMHFPAPEPSLPTLLVTQIDYYFSDANLITDEFLKSKMDDKGWVPISLIASFRRVKNLTTNIQLILDSLRNSTAVEVQGDKVRKRNEWLKWIHTSHRFHTDSISQSPGSSTTDTLTSCFEKVALGEAAGPSMEAARGKCSSEQLTSNGRSFLSNGVVTDQETYSGQI